MAPVQMETFGLSAPFLSGEVTSVTVLDPGLTPTHILKMTDPFDIKVDWNLSGIVAPGLSGDWKVAAALESFGGQAFEGQIGTTQTVPLTPPAPLTYTSTINVPANTITESGAYKLVVTILHENPAGTPQEMAGLIEGPLLQFYAT